MTDTQTTLQAVIGQALSANLDPIRNFLLSNPSEPLIATGSGGAETSGDFAALLYGARGGVATSVSPYTFNSFSDAALKTAKILLVSQGGHNIPLEVIHRRFHAGLQNLFQLYIPVVDYWALYDNSTVPSAKIACGWKDQRVNVVDETRYIDLSATYKIPESHE